MRRDASPGRGRFVVALAVLACATASLSHARTWTVAPDGSGDAPTIQAAIDSAAIGDVVLLLDGVFRGAGNCDIFYNGKDGGEFGDSLTVRSQSGDPETCIIDCRSGREGFFLGDFVRTRFVLYGVTVTGAERAVKSAPATLWNRVTLRKCVFSGNDRTGVQLIGDTEVIIDECVVSGSGWDGVTVSGPFTEVVFARCEFTDNGARGAAVDENDALFVDCRFSGNVGRGFRVYGGVVEMRRCEFTGNPNGAVWCLDGSFTALDCRFEDNANPTGGTVYAGETSVTLERCVFAGNDVLRGGALFVDNAGQPVRVTECTIVDNVAADGSAVYSKEEFGAAIEYSALAFNSGSPPVVCGVPDGVITVSCCDVYGNAAGDWVGSIAGQNGADGNFSADPLFCDVAGRVFTVAADSPCLATACGQIGALGEGCDARRVVLDLQPGVCPNEFSLDQRTRRDLSDERDLVTVALLGAPDFRVADVDVESLVLGGFAPVRTVVADMAGAGLDVGECACSVPGSDGRDDLSIVFLKHDLARAIGAASAGAVVQVALTGSLLDGTPFRATDCVSIVGQVALYDGVPNPFNPTTQIRYFLPRRTFVRLTVYDVAGRRVEELVARDQDPGDHIVEWTAREHASGVYFCRLDADGVHDTRKVVLVK